jgi:hypothetical protein
VTSEDIQTFLEQAHQRMKNEGRNDLTANENKELNRLVQAAIDFREEHEFHGEVIADELLKKHAFAPNVISEAKRQILIHDSPSCHGYEQLRPERDRQTASRFLFEAKDPTWVLRMADRGWMLSNLGIRFELSKKKSLLTPQAVGKKQPLPTPQAVANKVRSNLKNHWREAGFYKESPTEYGFIGKTLCRTEAAHQLYRAHLDRVETEFRVDLTELRTEYGLHKNWSEVQPR